MDGWLRGGTRCFTSSPCGARQAALAADGAGTCSPPHSRIAWPRACSCAATGTHYGEVTQQIRHTQLPFMWQTSHVAGPAVCYEAVSPPFDVAEIKAIHSSIFITCAATKPSPGSLRAAAAHVRLTDASDVWPHGEHWFGRAGPLPAMAMAGPALVAAGRRLRGPYGGCGFGLLNEIVVCFTPGVPDDSVL